MFMNEMSRRENMKISIKEVIAAPILNIVSKEQAEKVLEEKGIAWNRVHRNTDGSKFTYFISGKLVARWTKPLKSLEIYI